jgi:hypothetical protein
MVTPMLGALNPLSGLTLRLILLAARLGALVRAPLVLPRLALPFTPALAAPALTLYLLLAGLTLPLALSLSLPLLASGLTALLRAALLPPGALLALARRALARSSLPFTLWLPLTPALAAALTTLALGLSLAGAATLGPAGLLTPAAARRLHRAARPFCGPLTLRATAASARRTLALAPLLGRPILPLDRAIDQADSLSDTGTHARLLISANADGRHGPVLEFRHFRHDVIRRQRRRHIAWSERRVLLGRLVCLLLVPQAAHQPTAEAGNLRWVEGEVLVLRHPDGDRCEVAQEACAAQNTATRADAAQELGLVTDANLAHLNPRPEDASQIPYQLTKIDSTFGSKVEDDFRAIKCIFHVDQVHIETVSLDLLLSDTKGFVLFALVFRRHYGVLLSAHAQHFLQGLNHLIFIDVLRAHGHFAIFHAPGGFHHHIFARSDLILRRVEVVDLACLLKTHPDNANHSVTSLAVKPHG